MVSARIWNGILIAKGAEEHKMKMMMSKVNNRTHVLH